MTSVATMRLGPGHGRRLASHLVSMLALGALLGVGLASVLGGCCVDVENRLNRCATSLARVQGKVSSTEGKTSSMVALVAHLRQQLQRHKTQEAFLARRLEALGQKVGEAATMSAKAKAELLAKLVATRLRLSQMEAARQKNLARLSKLRALLRRFAALIKSGRIKVRLRDGRMVVVLSSQVLFAPGQARLKAQGRKAIAEIVAVLKAVRGRRFQVAGHTDDRPMRWGRYRSNWALSTARAVAVVRLMVKLGMPGSRLSAAGYGQFSPVRPNTKADDRAQNRRIEIVLQPRLDELPDLKSLFDK